MPPDVSTGFPGNSNVQDIGIDISYSMRRSSGMELDELLSSIEDLGARNEKLKEFL